MLTNHNSKLGRAIWGWSIPAVKTCPGASEACLALCYARKGRFFLPSIRDRLERNLQLSHSTEFVSSIIGQIRSSPISICRIHVAGDFYNVRYTQRWLKIIRACRRTTFYAYTRSWTKANLLPHLITLGREPNVFLYLSYDSSMVFPPRRKGTRICYLSANDQDLPRRKVDLVFRDNTKSVLKKDSFGNVVCPYDNGVTTTTCSHCGICWTRKAHENANHRRDRRNSKAAACRNQLASR